MEGRRWGCLCAGGCLLLGGNARADQALALLDPLEGATLRADQPVVLKFQAKARGRLLVLVDDGSTGFDRRERGEYVLQPGNGPGAFAAVVPGESTTLSIGRLRPGEHTIRIETADEGYQPTGASAVVHVRVH